MMKHWTIIATAFLVTLLAFVAAAPVACADIFQWRYINPSQPHWGKQPSTILAPGGGGVNAEPNENLSNRDLGQAYLAGANLTNANLTNANLSGAPYLLAAELAGANLSQANLTNANLAGYENYLSSFGYITPGANLSGADLTGAIVRGASFDGITSTQLYSTASYHTRDLVGIGLKYQHVDGWNFADQNLTGASFISATLTNANLSQANLTDGAFFGHNENTPEGTIYHLGANLTGANLVEANLTRATFYSATLTNANLSQANLTNADFTGATLNANLTGANIRGTNFAVTFLPYPLYTLAGGITLAQLYSTASYQAHDLTGIKLLSNDLTNGNFVGQNLTNANFVAATLTNANLSGAAVRGANFTKYATGGITVSQLSSTASYQAQDLTGIVLQGNSLGGVNLAGQKLTNAGFQGTKLANANLRQANLANANFSIDFDGYVNAADLTAANLSQANLTNAIFAGFFSDDENGEYIYPGANLTNANLSAADARGANFQYATLTGANTSNLIQSNGHIAGLDLTSGASLVVRDYAGGIPIVVDQHLAMDATSSLRLVFDADPWDSTISFAPGIPVARGGTLDLTFAPGVNAATQIGRTIDLFDWSGGTPTGTFTVSSPYTWDLSNLYTTGEVTLAALAAIPGDFNNNGVVDAADYVVWRKIDGTQAGYDSWRSHFGQPPGSGAEAIASAAVPEPATLTLLMFAAAGWYLRRGRAA